MRRHGESERLDLEIGPRNAPCASRRQRDAAPRNPSSEIVAMSEPALPALPAPPAPPPRPVHQAE